MILLFRIKNICLDNEENDEMNGLFLNNTISMSIDDNEKYFCELLQPFLNTFQWQLPILPRKTNSSNLIYEKRMAKIDFKHMKVRANSNNNINIIGKRVKIKSNSSSRTSISATKPYSSIFLFFRTFFCLTLSCFSIQGQQQSRILYALNYNNNYNRHADSILSSEFSTSVVDTRLSSTTIDSLSSINSNSLDNNNNTDQSIIQSQNLSMITNHSKSGR